LGLRKEPYKKGKSPVKEERALQKRKELCKRGKSPIKEERAL